MALAKDAPKLNKLRAQLGLTEQAPRDVIKSCFDMLASNCCAIFGHLANLYKALLQKNI